MLQSIMSKDSQSGIPDDCVLPVSTPEGLKDFDEYLGDKAKFSQMV